MNISQPQETSTTRTREEEVEQLNDEQLYETLVSFGANIGPIVGSTRGLYQKLLMSLLEETEKAHVEIEQVEVPENEEGQDDLEEETDVELTGDEEGMQEEEEEEEEEDVMIVEDVIEDNVDVFRKRRVVSASVRRQFEPSYSSYSHEVSRVEGEETKSTFLKNSLIIGFASVFGSLFALYLYQIKTCDPNEEKC